MLGLTVSRSRDRCGRGVCGWSCGETLAFTSCRFVRKVDLLSYRFSIYSILCKPGELLCGLITVARICLLSFLSV